MEALSFDHLVEQAVTQARFENNDGALLRLRLGIEENPEWVDAARDRVAFYADDQANSVFAKTALWLLRETLKNLPEAACLTPAS